MNVKQCFAGVLVLGPALWLSGCGGGGSSGSFTVSTSVSGLATGQSVVLEDNGSDNLTITANGTVAFHTLLANGAPYAVTVLTQPVGENCVVTKGAGAVPNANVAVAVACTVLSYTIGGSVSGLVSGNSVVLDNTGVSPATISANGPYTFSGPLPSGTSYSVSVGTQPSGENCSVANGTGTLAGTNVTNVNITCTANRYAINVNVVGLLPNSTLVLQNNGGNNLTVTTGGVFPFSAAVASGSAYAVTIATQPAGQTCTVAKGSGRVAAAAVTVLVTCPWHVLYIETVTGLIGFAIDPTSGVLAPLPNAAITPPYTYVITDSSGKRVYTVGLSAPLGGDATSSFSINPTTGALTQIAGSPYNDTTNVAGPSTVLINPSDPFAYALDGSGTVFSINQSTGLLTPTGSTQGLQVGSFAKANSPHFASCTIRPDGLFAYCPAGGPIQGQVVEYSLNQTTGAAAQVATTSVGQSPVLISITPNGKFAYVMQPDGESSVLYGFTIDSVSGALTPIAGSPFAVPSAPAYLVPGINNSVLYVRQSGSIITYSIDPGSGVLTLQPGSIAAPGGVSYGLALDPSGKFLYFVGGTGLSGASIDTTTGALTLLPGSPFFTTSDGADNPFAIAPIIH